MDRVQSLASAIPFLNLACARNLRMDGSPIFRLCHPDKCKPQSLRCVLLAEPSNIRGAPPACSPSPETGAIFFKGVIFALFEGPWPLTSAEELFFVASASATHVSTASRSDVT